MGIKIEDFENGYISYNDWNIYCRYLLELLMDKNKDVLKRLKEI